MESDVLRKTIYLDNGATSFPKPPEVAAAVHDYICNIGASINRSVYESAQNAGLTAYVLRERLARLFCFDNPRNVIITPGNTYGLNMVIKGLLGPGDHCLVSSMEHNAVMRPLVQLQKQGAAFDRIPCDRNGFLNPDMIPDLMKENTKLVVIAHGSNVGGGVQDIERIGGICKEMGVFFMVDGAQTAGHYPIDFKKACLSALSVPGHKGLMGPSGIGALLLTSELAEKLEPIVSGGTGSASDSEELPAHMPDRFEPGTSNLPGIYGLEAALHFIENQGVEKLKAHEDHLTKRFLSGIFELQRKYRGSRLRLVGPQTTENRVGVVSLDFMELDNAEISYRLETDYGILTRCGMHCAPSAHMTLGTFPQGVVRFSIGYYNTDENIDAALEAIREILQNQ